MQAFKYCINAEVQGCRRAIPTMNDSLVPHSPQIKLPHRFSKSPGYSQITDFKKKKGKHYLELNVPWVLNVLLQINPIISKCSSCLALSLL